MRYLRGYSQVAEYLGVSKEAARAILKSGAVPSVRLGVSYLVAPEALDAAIRNGISERIPITRHRPSRRKVVAVA